VSKKSSLPMSRGLALANPLEAFGLPPPRDGMSAREFAISLLRAAAEVEHSLLVQYLYAAYSVDERAEHDTNNTGLRWKTDIRLIAREEMAHLVTVQNLLLSLKRSELHLNRGPIDQDVKTLPLPFQLEPLSERSLEKYILFESPTPNLLPGETSKLVKDIQERLGPESRVLSVGIIYAALYWLFLESDDPGDDWPFAPESVSEFRRAYKTGFHLRASDFVDRSTYLERAAEPDEWGVYEEETRVDGASPRDTALGSLRWIMAQGEGPNVIEQSHFFRFVGMYKKFKQISGESLVLPVPSNPQLRRTTQGTVIRNRVSRRWAELGNSRYQLLILNIFESLNAKRTTETNKRRLFSKWAISEMELIKKIGQLLPRMFLAGSAAKSAGAIFEEVALPETAPKRLVHRQWLIKNSDSWIAEIAELRKRKHVGPVPEHTDDATTAGLEESVLDAVARQNDEMREVLRRLEVS
jgi:Ferritin-like